MRPARPVQRSFLGQFVRDLLDTWGCGLLWILLGGLILLQTWLVLAGEIRLPDFLRDRLQTQLAEQGLRADYRRVILDPTGAILVENLALAPASSEEPLLTARHVLVRLDPWHLLAGRAQIDTLEATGLDLMLPAFNSPSGKSEAVLADVQFRLHVEEGRLVTFDALSGRLSGVPVALDGAYTLALPTRDGTREPPSLTAYYPLARRLVTLGEQLRPLGAMTLRGHLAPDRITLEVRAPLIDLAALPASPLPPLVGEARDTILQLTLPLDSTARPEARAAIARLELLAPDFPAFSAEHLHARLTGGTLLNWDDLSALRLDATAVTLAAGPLSLNHTGLRLAATDTRTLDADLVASLDGHPWRVRFHGQPATRSGQLTLDAHPTAGLLAAAEPLVPLRIPLTTLLQLGPPPRLRARVELAPGGRPVRAEGRLEGGGAVAYHVPIDAAAADFSWHDDELAFTDILLRLNRSEARGSYAMNIASRDFRFLLTGHLDPPDIAGWFHDWWPEFWKTFAFTTPPETDVEVRGRWGDPYDTTVFVAAEGRALAMNTQPLAHLRTRLFIRPGWYDALNLHARHPDGGVADGRFGYASDPSDASWRSLDFDLVSTLPADAIVRLLGPAAADLFRPFTFTAAPRIQVVGRAAAPDRRDLTLGISTERPFTFHDFKFETLDVHGRMTDQELTLDPMQAGFAGGRLSGRAVVSGPNDDRWVAIDHRLVGADLDTALDLLDERKRLTSPAKTETPADDPATPRRPGGRLDLSLQANGPLDQPELLQGSGQADITGAHFAQIRLFGILSSILKSTGLGFTSLSLETLSTSYQLSEGQLSLPDLRISGPSAVVEAEGRYSLEDQKLDFKAKLSPYEGRGGVIGSTVDFVLSPLSKALEFRLTGSLDDPDWSFIYGPRGLLRAITGEKATPPADDTPPPAENP